MYRRSINPCLVALLAIVASTLDLKAQETANDPTDGPTALRRSRNFNFEEAAERPVAFPDFFFRPGPDQGAGAQGFPLFGSIQITDQSVHLGKHSLVFRPDGHSMAARLMTGVCPVLPGTDYHVSAHIRTKGLKRSRARVVAWLLDEHGAAIPGTRQESEPLITNGRWELVSVVVPTDHPKALDLVLELQLLQPAQLPRTESSFDQPVLADVGGYVWFDDVLIEQKPRVWLSTVSPGGVSRAPEQPRLILSVDDMSAAPLDGVLRVADHQGQVIAAIEIDNLSNTPARTIALPLPRYGWFEASLEIHEYDRLLIRKSVSLAWVPPQRHAHQNSRLGVAWTPPSQQSDRLPQIQSAITLIDELPIQMVQIPIWPSPGASQRGSIPLLDSLLEEDHTLLLVLAQLPEALARSLALNIDQVFEAITERFAVCEPFLTDLIVSVGVQSTRWQVGPSESKQATIAYMESGSLPDAPEGLTRLIPNATMYLPWPANLPIPEVPEHVSLTLSLDQDSAPKPMVDVAADWKSKVPNAVVVLEPAQQTNQAMQGVRGPARLAQLTMQLWRYGPETILLTQPWTDAPVHEPQLQQPHPNYGAWRTLAAQLAQRTFATELDLSEGVHAWVLHGRTHSDACLVMWTDKHDPWSRQSISMLLGSGTITATDLFGNQSWVPMVDGTHVVQVGPEPVFLEGIDASLLSFVAEMALAPSFVPSVHRSTEMELHIRNPWNTALIASIDLQAPEGWRISPKTNFLNMAPGQHVTIPIDAVVPVNVTAGTHMVEAIIDLTTDRHYQFRRLLPIRTGLPDVNVAAATHTVIGQVDDVAVQVSLNNQSSTLRTVKISAAGPGLRQIAPTALKLQPNGITHHRLIIPGGLAPASDGTLWLILEDDDSNARLAKPLDLVTAVQP